MKHPAQEMAAEPQGTDSAVSNRIHSMDDAQLLSGTRETPPPALRNALEMIAACRQPAWVVWGADHRLFANEPCRVLAGLPPGACRGAPAGQHGGMLWSAVQAHVRAVQASGEAAQWQLDLAGIRGVCVASPLGAPGTDAGVWSLFRPVESEGNAGGSGLGPETGGDRCASAAPADEARWFLDFLDRMPVGAWMKDEGGRYIFANPGAAEFLGRAPAKLLGRTDAELFPPEVADTLRARDLAAQRAAGGVRSIESSPRDAEDTGSRRFVVTRFAMPAIGARGIVSGGIAIDGTVHVECEPSMERERDVLEQRVREGTVKLEQAHARFRAVFDQGGFSAILDRDGRVVEVNRSWLEAMGVSPVSVVGRPFWEAEWWGDLPDVQAWIKIGCAEASRGARFQGDTVCRGRGPEVRLDLALSPIRNPQGEIDLIVATGIDISARHQWSRERERMDVVRETEAQFRRMANAAPVLIWMADTEYRGTWFNQQWLDFVGRPMERELDQGWLENVHADDLERCVRRGREVLEQRLPFEMEFRLRRHDGEFRWVLNRGVPTLQPDGQFAGFIGTLIDITERKQAERAIQRLAAIVESSGDAILAVDLDGYVTNWNRGAELLYGYTEVEMIGQPIALLVPEDRRDEDRRLSRRIGAGETVEHIETQRMRKDGSLVDVSVSMSPIRDETGLIVGVSRIVRDISERKRTEAELRRREQLYRAIGESINYGIWVSDATGRLLFVSDSLARLLGTRPEDVGRHEWIRFLHPDDVAETERSWGECLRSGAQWEREHRFMDTAGQAHPVLSRGVPVREEGGRITRWVGIHLDISRLKQKEEALRESEERFRTLADNITQFAWTADERGRILWFNRRWFEFTGMDSTIPDTWSAHSVHHPEHEQRVSEKYRRCIADGTVWEDTFPLRRHDGVYRWFLSRAVPIRRPDGAVVRWFGTNTDITALREIEHQLERTRDEALAASRAKDDFLAALSHELRTPLNPVLLLASDAAEDVSLPDTVREDFAAIRKQVSLEARLIDDLLDLTRISRGLLSLECAELEVNRLVRDALAAVTPDIAAKSIALEVCLDPGNPRARGDGVRLQQALWNLLKNAFKFTPSGGRIVVSTSLQAENREVAIQVADTGIGISKEELSRIFQAFSQGDHAAAGAVHRFGGLGLGLTISQRVVEMHGGRLEASSGGPGRGSEFVITLPALGDGPAGSAGDAGTAAADAGRVDRPGRRVLVVEDHGPTRAALKRLLVRRGFEVIAADSAADARSAMREIGFDLFVSDIGLPDGNGCDLMRECADLLGVPGIALTGYGMENDLARSREAGFAAHLTKPVSVQSLDRAIQDALQPRGAVSAQS